MIKKTCDGCKALREMQYHQECGLKFPVTIKTDTLTGTTTIKPAVECPKPTTYHKFVRLQLERSRKMTSESQYHSVNWGPLATNIIDHIGDKNLITPDGTEVRLTRNGMDFRVALGNGGWYQTKDNLQMSFYLNSHEVGMK